MESNRKSSEASSRRRSLLPLASEEKSYVPAFYRPRSAVEGRRRPTLERRSVSSLEEFNKEDGDLDRILSPRLTPRGNVTPRRVREEDKVVAPNKDKSSSRSPRRAARGSEQLNMPLRPDTPFHGTRSSSRIARTPSREAIGPSVRKASIRSPNDARKFIKEEDEIKERGNGNEDSGGDKEKGKVKSRACRPSTPLVTCGRQPLVRRTSKKRLDSTSELSDKESVSSGIKPRNQRLRSAGGSEGSTCNSQASSRRSSIVSLSRSSSKVNLNDLPGPDPFSQAPNSTLPAPPGKRPNMATLLNVLQFKRTLRRKHNSRRPSVLAAASETIDEKEELELLEADPLAAPGQRFALGLSKEAQYAMLKGYEDRIQQEIQDDDVPTPREGVPDSTEAFRDLTLASAGDTAYKTKMNWKLENAMDIIDSLLSSSGHNVTSERHKKKVSDPVRHYRRWTRACDHDLAMARVKLGVQGEASS